MILSEQVRVVVFLPRALMDEIKLAAEAAGETVPDAMRARLASSLFSSQTAARSGCAGRGEAAVSASPELGSATGGAA
ncbi:hypothetical protein EBB05_15895 [Methylobacterium brachiatum]|nr:hypothetical protein EBB05_15895 [Methylobacterium brachiatum]